MTYIHVVLVCSLNNNIKKWWGKSEWSPLLIWFNIHKLPYKLKNGEHRGLKNEFDNLNSIILSIQILKELKSLKQEKIRDKTRFYVVANRKIYTKIG